ncbi:MAG: hypothetical protein ACXQT6_02160 [Candidatus Methanospirareceae archaeon]
MREEEETEKEEVEEEVEEEEQEQKEEEEGESEEAKARRYQGVLRSLGFHEKRESDGKVRFILREGDLTLGRTFTEQHPTGRFWALQNDKFLPEEELKDLEVVKRFYAVAEGEGEEDLEKREEVVAGAVLPALPTPKLPTPKGEKEIVADAQQKADSLYAIVEKQHLYQEMHGKKYLQLEAWQTLGRFCNLAAFIEWTKPVELWGAKGFEARAVIKDSEGNTVSAAEAMCMSDEANWKRRPIFQVRSMAQTRALSKAYRSCLSFIVSLVGYAVTPAEEVEEGGH